MKKKSVGKIVLALALVMVILVGVVYFAGNRKPAYSEETARTMTIETFYTFSGNIQPDGFKVVTATNRGTIREWKLEEGDTVSEDGTVMLAKSGTKFTAPMDGTISNLYLDEGEDFAPGDALFRVADYAHPVIKIKVDEYDVSSLIKGMNVDVKVQATGKTLTGEITRIAQEATVENSLAYYEVEIALPQDGTLAMGLTCEVSIPRACAKDATTISMNAIQYDDNGKPFVYCYSRGNEIVQQSVLLGINNGSIVEIRDGVKSGETILIPDTWGDAAMLPMMRMMR
ncbi:MAG: HlyD family efflux transporter periplasmic adaptor subunit [Aristaeellaceae bacterium]